MPGDRGTLTRGAQPAHDKEPRRPTAPGRRRPPQVARERRPALAALALLLIVGGALGAAYLVLQNGHRVAAIEVTQQLGAGERIPPDALREVDIAVSGGIGYVPWSQAAHVSQYQVSDATQSCPGTPGGLLASNAVVLGISAPPAAASASAVDVRVALDPAAAGAVTCNAANNNVAVAVLPGSATGGAG